MEGKRVDSKLMLFTLVLVLIALLLLNWLLGNKETVGVWDYDNITSASEIKYLGTKVTDRETYYTLESIISKYLDSYINVYDQDKIMYEDYYNYLVENYKKHLSKKEYIEIAKKFLNKFYINMNSDYESMDTNKILKDIYEFENGIYLCELKSNRNNEAGYIAVQVNKIDMTFNIVYIE